MALQPAWRPAKPTYHSVEEYLAAREKLKESPLACVVMLGGPALLMHEGEGRSRRAHSRAS